MSNGKPLFSLFPVSVPSTQKHPPSPISPPPPPPHLYPLDTKTTPPPLLFPPVSSLSLSPRYNSPTLPPCLFPLSIPSIKNKQNKANTPPPFFFSSSSFFLLLSLPSHYPLDTKKRTTSKQLSIRNMSMSTGLWKTHAGISRTGGCRCTNAIWEHLHAVHGFSCSKIDLDLDGYVDLGHVLA